MRFTSVVANLPPEAPPTSKRFHRWGHLDRGPPDDQLEGEQHRYDLENVRHSSGGQWKRWDCHHTRDDSEGLFLKYVGQAAERPRPVFPEPALKLIAELYLGRVVGNELAAYPQSIGARACW